MDNKKIDTKIKILNSLKKIGIAKDNVDSRLPKGQRLIKEGFPVLDLGKQPEVDLDEWKLELFGDCVQEKKISFSLKDLKKICGEKDYTKDFHCVTRWSKYDVRWRGLSLNNLISYLIDNKILKEDWKHMIQYGFDDYSTNVKREDLRREECFIAFSLDGKEIPKEHGVIRVIIPKLYAWKGSKFLKALEFSTEDKMGLWEKYGYHNHGDAFLEERYS